MTTASGGIYSECMRSACSVTSYERMERRPQGMQRHVFHDGQRIQPLSVSSAGMSCPSNAARRLRAERTVIPTRVSVVALPMCGRMTHLLLCQIFFLPLV
jgi:hypothetical protein